MAGISPADSRGADHESLGLDQSLDAIAERIIATGSLPEQKSRCVRAALDGD